MEKITKDIANSYIKWNLYVISSLKANVKNCVTLLQITSEIGIAITSIMLSNRPLKREDVLTIYSKIISIYTLVGRKEAESLKQRHLEFLKSLESLEPKINQDIKFEDSELDEILNDMAKKGSKHQA